jgi:RHH-type proline utilization regulon transcriptional repressor/proline dehydrogenase/delta 1-pyrroline-5-carboxylate dehydrogenase
MTELYARLKELLVLAKQYNIGLNIDAEEADRMELSLDLLEQLAFDKDLAGWNGIGLVVQAYQKRCPSSSIIWWIWHAAPVTASWCVW